MNFSELADYGVGVFAISILAYLIYHFFNVAERVAAKRTDFMRSVLDDHKEERSKWVALYTELVSKINGGDKK
jgi:hypothetical protein